ncbi:hypothetical protein SDC9_185477 [bioreactor metagenome]|uniref:Uncharacterized protein n=1 Tax=bioreactor metagenome TaxID=1076179 RepID=A0A645HH97_9ZZZZ
MQALVALERERVGPVKLILTREARTDVAIPRYRRIHNGLRNHGLRNKAFREAAEPAAVSRATVRDLGRRRQWGHGLHTVQRPLDELELVGTRLTNTLHTKQGNL